MNESITRHWALREQAAYLRSPLRRSGPAASEAEEAAAALEREAEELSESLFYQHKTS